MKHTRRDQINTPGLLDSLLAFSLLQIKQRKTEVKLWWLCHLLSKLDYRAALEGGLVWRNVFIRTGDCNASQWAANKSVNAPDDVLLHWKRPLWTKFSSKSSWNETSLVWGTVKKNLVQHPTGLTYGSNASCYRSSPAWLWLLWLCGSQAFWQ